MIFSGGMPRASYGDNHTVTVMQGDRHVVFDFTSKVIDFFVVCASDEVQHGNGQSDWFSMGYYFSVRVSLLFKYSLRNCAVMNIRFITNKNNS